MAEPQEQHHEDPGIGYLEDLNAILRPLSDAEIAKRRRMQEDAGEVDPVGLECLRIFIREGLA